jgi:hypothetical protein
MLEFFKKRWRERRPLRAVHEPDLQSFLQSLGLLDQVQRRLGKCTVCGDTVGIDNLGAVSPAQGGANLICNKPHCVAGAVAGSEEDGR